MFFENFSVYFRELLLVYGLLLPKQPRLVVLAANPAAPACANPGSNSSKTITDCAASKSSL